MKSLCILVLAVFAACEGISTQEKIAKKTHAKLISNVPVRRAYSSGINFINRGLYQNGGSSAETLALTVPTPVPPTTAPTDTPCDQNNFKCENDEIIFCDPGDITKTEKLKCSEYLDTKTGYCNCDNDKCQVSPPTNCPGVPPQSTCDKPGLFTPSATNCKQFSYCDEGDLLYYECEDNLIYDAKAQECRVGVCRTVLCPTTQIARPVYVPFPQDDSWYLLCYKGKSTIGHCPEGLVADSTGCYFKCPGVGNFADPKKPNPASSYYSCTGTAPNYKKTLKTCADKYVFDKDKKICLKKKI